MSLPKSVAIFDMPAENCELSFRPSVAAAAIGATSAEILSPTPMMLEPVFWMFFAVRFWTFSCSVSALSTLCKVGVNLSASWITASMIFAMPSPPCVLYSFVNGIFLFVCFFIPTR